MATLIEEARAYEGKETKNIADLPKVSTVLEITEKKGMDNKNEEYTYKVITIEGIEYRVPASVLKSLKTILEDNPNLKEFKVKKTGQGMDTEYTVIPLA